MHAVNNVTVRGLKPEEWWAAFHWRDERSRNYVEYPSMTQWLERDFGYKTGTLTYRPRAYGFHGDVWTSTKLTHAGRRDERWRPRPMALEELVVEGKPPYGGTHENGAFTFWRSGYAEAKWYPSAESGPVIVLGTRGFDMQWGRSNPPNYFDSFGVYLFQAMADRHPRKFPDGNGNFCIARHGDGAYVTITPRELGMLEVYMDALLEQAHLPELPIDGEVLKWPMPPSYPTDP